MYEVNAWGPGCCGDFVGQTAYEVEAYDLVLIAQAMGCAAQVTHPAWSGYVTTWEDGSASAKYFCGCDDNGFGGDIPESACRLVERLDARLSTQA